MLSSSIFSNKFGDRAIHHAVNHNYIYFQIQDCTDNEEMSNLQDEHKFCSIVDRSGWPIECVINMKPRFDFVSQILMEELFDKRLSAL